MRATSRILRVLATLLFAGFLTFGTVATPANAVINTTKVTTPQKLVSLNMTPQAQEKNLWCWAGASNIIANHYGADVSQNEFCNRAKGNTNLTAPCPNTTGDLYDIRRAWNSLGIYGSNATYAPISFNQIKQEIDAGRPVMARIQWKSNGMGHFLVIEGYDEATQQIQWIDPWGSSKRVNVGKYSNFLNDERYRWTHTVTNIGIYATPKNPYIRPF